MSEPSLETIRLLLRAVRTIFSRLRQWGFVIDDWKVTEVYYFRLPLPPATYVPNYIGTYEHKTALDNEIAKVKTFLADEHPDDFTDEKLKKTFYDLTYLFGGIILYNPKTKEHTFMHIWKNDDARDEAKEFSAIMVSFWGGENKDPKLVPYTFHDVKEGVFRVILISPKEPQKRMVVRALLQSSRNFYLFTYDMLSFDITTHMFQPTVAASKVPDVDRKKLGENKDLDNLPPIPFSDVYIKFIGAIPNDVIRAKSLNPIEDSTIKNTVLSPEALIISRVSNV